MDERHDGPKIDFSQLSEDQINKIRQIKEKISQGKKLIVETHAGSGFGCAPDRAGEDVVYLVVDTSSHGVVNLPLDKGPDTLISLGPLSIEQVAQVFESEGILADEIVAKNPNVGILSKNDTFNAVMSMLSPSGVLRIYDDYTTQGMGLYESAIRQLDSAKYSGRIIDQTELVSINQEFFNMRLKKDIGSASNQPVFIEIRRVDDTQRKLDN